MHKAEIAEPIPPTLIRANQINLTDVFAFSGNNTHSGTETFTGAVTLGKWNSIITVDGTQFTTCDAAVTAAIAQAGTGLALVIVPSTYVGAACTTIPTNNHVQVWYFNNIDPLVQSGVFWNTSSATPVNAWFRPQVNFPSPPGNALSVYAIARFSGVIPGNSAMDAISPEAQSVGAITSVAAGTKLQASENVVTLASTGGTWPDIRAGVFYVQDTVANTTNSTNTSAIFVPTMSKTGSGNYGTLAGAIFSKQTAGNVANWAAQFFGTTLFSFNAANEQLQISGNATANSNGLSIANTAASGHTWVLGETFGVGHFSFRDTTQGGTPYWSFAVTGAAGVEGVLSHANTVSRTYTFPDANGTVAFNPPAVAGTTDLGTIVLPFGNLWLGTAATNNFKLQPASTTGARIITIADPLSPTTVGLPFTIANGTSTLTVNAALAAVTSQAAITTAGTGILTTDTIEWSYASAPTAGDSLCHVSAYVTAGNVNFVRTNPTAAAQSVSALVINWRVIR